MEDSAGFWAGTPGKVKGECRDNAVTLAVSAYAQHEEGARDLLDMVLDAGGNPNTRQCDGDPVIMKFFGSWNFEIDLAAISYLHSKGADLSLLTRAGRSLIYDSCLAGYWDAAWYLLELGAPYDSSLAFCFQGPPSVYTDDYEWPFMKETWNFLHSKGIALPPLRAAD